MSTTPIISGKELDYQNDESIFQDMLTKILSSLKSRGVGTTEDLGSISKNSKISASDMNRLTLTLYKDKTYSNGTVVQYRTSDTEEIDKSGKSKYTEAQFKDTSIFPIRLPSEYAEILKSGDEVTSEFYDRLDSMYKDLVVNKSACSAGCINKCSNSCDDTCTGSCNSECYQSCSGHCASTCSHSAIKVCWGMGCGCNGDCGSGCLSSCESSCSDGCNSSCIESCINIASK